MEGIDLLISVCDDASGSPVILEAEIMPAIDSQDEDPEVRRLREQERRLRQKRLLRQRGRPSTDAGKLQGNSLPEIKEAWKAVAGKLALDPEVAREGGLSHQNVLVAWALWALLAPHQERLRITRWGLRAFDALRRMPSLNGLAEMTRSDLGIPLAEDEEITDDTGDHEGRPRGGQMVTPKPATRKSSRTA